MNTRYWKVSFTLVELVIAVIIVSVISSLALVTYRKTIERMDERNIAINLKLMMSKLDLKFTKEGYHLITDQNNLDAINNYLGLNIPDDGRTAYTCTDTNTTVSDRNVCTAVSRYGWRIHAHYREQGSTIDQQGQPQKPHCFENDCCPTCAHIPTGKRNCGRAAVDGQQGCAFF
ncbi:MAG TPA: hypothetical protein VLJ10_05320 [Candidatus Bathyarchaeia archaeon]|nr:hypothetical protein [Candidatus Bathyarchaeia archaeon]